MVGGIDIDKHAERTFAWRDIKRIKVLMFTELSLK